MRSTGLGLLIALGSSQVLAQACVVHSHSERLDVKVCQENLNIPTKLFSDGFCQPSLAGQKVEVEYVEQCPGGSFGVCQNALVANMPYRQNIHYYGVATDAAYLKPFCEGRSDGHWQIP
ncbi:NADH:ubiquinone oxidoreductase [Pseudomonas agarici]|uniref:NADH:ubiquinone oxidoreductase n=1 Tax=Pseudomonas agarici TaxID=46677 RepID=A0A0X1T895_PSEAA|nr:NADH:ubiquinone oxidoreductase [Pseudomonas agarici]